MCITCRVGGVDVRLDYFVRPPCGPGRGPVFAEPDDSLWYGSDLALLGRRAEVWSNRGRAAIGRNGLYEYSKEEDLIDHKGKLCEKKCDGWNGQQDSWAKRRLGHNYQTEKDALEYYRLEMKNNCDNKC